MMLQVSSLLRYSQLDYLDRRAVTRSEGHLLDLASSLDRESVPPEHLLDRRDVLLHLAHRAEPDLAQDQHQRLCGERLVPAPSLHCSSLHFTDYFTPFDAEER